MGAFWVFPSGMQPVHYDFLEMHHLNDVMHEGRWHMFEKTCFVHKHSHQRAKINHKSGKCSHFCIYACFCEWVHSSLLFFPVESVDPIILSMCMVWISWAIYL